MLSSAFKILPHEQSVELVLESCGQFTTWHIEGPNATHAGMGDLHLHRFDDLGYEKVMVSYEDVPGEFTDIVCDHTIRIYPTESGRRAFVNTNATLYPIAICAIFVFTAAVFMLYDFVVTRRQAKTETEANRTGAIVEELFPGNVASQLYSAQTGQKKKTMQPSRQGEASSSTGSPYGNNFIAELYPEATILFADICGFTAWASIREPHQVFLLLETVFQSFDVLAKRHGVFKASVRLKHGENSRCYL